MREKEKCSYEAWATQSNTIADTAGPWRPKPWITHVSRLSNLSIMHNDGIYRTFGFRILTTVNGFLVVTIISA